MANPAPGPKFSEYGLRYYTNSLTKEETKELHKWRMKNDPDYREKIKVDRLRKKAAAEKTKKAPAKKAPAKKAPAAKPKTTGGSRGGAGLSVPRSVGVGAGAMARKKSL